MMAVVGLPDYQYAWYVPFPYRLSPCCSSLPPLCLLAAPGLFVRRRSRRVRRSCNAFACLHASLYPRTELPLLFLPFMAFVVRLIAVVQLACSDGRLTDGFVLLVYQVDLWGRLSATNLF